MKFCLYTSTPGLQPYPETERFRVWRSTHKRLMQEDADYRRDVRRFRSRVVRLTLLFMLVVTFLSGGVVLSVTKGPAAILLNVAGLGVLCLGYTIYIVFTSFRVQELMNERVGKALYALPA